MHRTLPAVVLSAVLLAPLAGGQEAGPIRPPVSKISLFKNGLAYVQIDVPSPAADGWVTVIPPSLPLHGSFWVASAAGGPTVAEAVAERVRTTESKAAETIPELLRANMGREVTVRSGDREYRGRLKPAPRRERRDPEWPGHPAELEGDPSLVLVETMRGVVALQPSAIQEVLFGEGEIESRYEREVERNRFRLRFERAAAGATVSVHYLMRGLAWAPSYRVVLDDSGECRIHARTDVLDDAMDLEKVPALLVSGFPNLRFTHVPGPLSLSSGLDEFLSLLAAEPESRGRREVWAQSQAVYSNAAFQVETGMAGATSGGFEGEAQEDMFFTRLGELSVSRGGRANVPLFEAAVPCEQVFRWEIGDYLNTQGYYQPREENVPQEVWHSLRLTNATASPWTTAPVTVFRGDSILGQDVLFYTPAGGKTLVKVTKALTIQAEEKEREVDRARQAETIYGSYFDRVTIEGTLFLCSYKAKDVTVEIAKTLSGEIAAVSNEPEVAALGQGLAQVNPMQRLNWRLTLPAGKEVRITYKYTVLVRH